MKKTRLLTLIMAVLLMICIIPANTFAGVDPNGHVDPDNPGNFIFTADITDATGGFSVLKDYLSYNTITLKGNILTNDFTTFAALGMTGSTPNPGEFIPTVVYAPMFGKGEWPINKFPAYDVANNQFFQVQSMKTSHHHDFGHDCRWVGTFNYVYQKDGNNTKKVIIDHDVKDINGLAMMPYASALTGVTKDITPGSENLITITLQPGSTNFAKVEYNTIINTRTNQGRQDSSIAGLAKSYTYNVTPIYLSTVGFDEEIYVLGSIKIVKESKYGVKLAGAVYNIFEDQDCQVPAQRYDAAAKAWVPVGDVTTGNDGTVTVTNLPNGTYYVKEKAAPAGYILDSTTVKSVVVVKEDLDLSIDTSSGEGSNLIYVKDSVNLSPVWNQIGILTNDTQDLPFKDLPGTSKISAAASVFGGDVFFKAAGNHVSFKTPTDVEKLDSYTKLTDVTYSVNVYGKASANFTSTNLADTLGYVNDTLIDDNKIDDATVGRNHVTITTTDDLDEIYYFNPNAKVASVTFVNEALPVDITVNKSWFNKTEPQPGEVVTVQLYQDGEEFGDAVKLDSKNKWTYTWKELEGGHEYDVKEASMPDNCILVGIEREGNIFTITNKVVKDVQVTKSWFNDTPALRGETLEVQLYKDGKEYGESVMLTADNDWTYVWENVEAKGKYTVKEVEVPRGYKVSYESQLGEDIDLLLIKNTFVKQSPKTGDDTLLIVCAAATVAGLVYVALKLRKEQ